MKLFKQNSSAIYICLLEILIGILLLINPEGFTKGIIIGLGIILALVGIARVINYFSAEKEVAAINQTLFKGLIFLTAGVFLAFNSQWFINLFSLLAVIYGIGVLIAGLAKIQWTVDMLRMKMKQWYLPAIGAAVSILCAVIILLSPFETTMVLWIFTGVSLIVEAVLDIVALCFRIRNDEKTVSVPNNKAE